MTKNSDDSTFKFLSIFYDKMIYEGKNYQVVTLSIDDSFLCILNEKLRDKLSLKDTERLADICFANGWIKLTTMGSKYNNLQLTATGLGIVKSKIRQIQDLRSRSVLKKFADYIDDHKGLFILLSFLVSFLSFAVAVLSLIFSLKKGGQ